MGDLKEIKQWRKKATPHIFALEPRMLFDGVTVVDTQINDSQNIELTTQDITHLDSIDLSTESSSATISSQLNVIGDINLSIPALIDWQNALISSQKSFTDFVNSDQYLLTLADIFKSQDLDINTFNERIDVLKQSILSIGLNAEIELRSSIELKGYLAAYHFDEETGLDHIYVNRDWIEFGVGEEMIHRAIIEEIGHAIDHRLNGAADAIGDEGEYFSRIITNDILTLDEINRIKNENDHNQIYIDGKYIDVEFATITFISAYRGMTDNTYSSIGTSYSVQSSQIYIGTPISSTSFSFVTANPADVTFSGNNMAGKFSFYENGSYVVINGILSRQDKVSGNTKGVYFVETTVLGGTTLTGKAFLFVMPGYSYSNNSSVNTDSSPFASNLNTVLTTQSSNRAPVINSNGGGETAIIDFTENTAIATQVTRVTATDADSDTLNYSIYGGADAALFSINSSTGVLTFKSSPNYENPLDADKNNIYDVRVMVADSKGASDTQTLSVNVTNVNDNVPIITSNGGGDTASVSIPQLTTAVTKVIATDADSADTVTYTITGGTNSSLFSIDVNSGQLAFKSAPTYNVSGSNSYQVIVTASDGTNTDLQTITVSVTNIDNIAPTLAITSDKSLLGAGKTAIITFTFSGQVQGFASSDITVSGGSLGALSQDPSYPNIYRAIFTQSGTSTAPSFTVGSGSYQDLSSNNGSAASLTLSYDVIAPTVGVDISGTDIAFGQTKVVTFTFSEDVVGTFTIGDIASTNAVISNLIQSSIDPKVFTASVQSTSAVGGPVVVAVGGSYTDAAGNLGSEGSDSATLSSPSIDLANTTASDTGSSSVDNITSERKPVIVGNAPLSESTVKVTVVSGTTTLIYNSVSVTSGTWSLNLATSTPSSGTMPSAGLASGYVGLTVTLNSDSNVTASSSFLIDYTAPSVPTVVSQTSNTSTPTLSGTAASDTDVLKVTLNGITYTSGDGYLSYITGTTSWSLLIPSINALSTGIYQVTVISYDIAGNSSEDITSNELTVNLNTAAPIIDLAPSDGSTKNNSATYTQSGSPVAFSLSGTNISDSDSTNFTSLTVSYSLSSIESGDRFEIGSTIVYLSSTNTTGSVYFNGTYFTYEFLVINGVNYVQFTSRNATNTGDATGPLASYEALLDNLKFSNDASSFTNNSSRTFTVVINDGNQNSLSSQFTITMAALNNAPTDILISSSSIAENQSSGTAVGSFSSNDPDAGNTFTYSLVTGVGSEDNSSFTIDGTGNLVTAASFNYEVKNSYSIRIRSTDQGGLYTEKVFVITVTNVNEAPTVTSALSTTFAENGTGTAYTVTGTDPDAATTLSYSISGTDAALFNINSSTGAITFKTSPNYESASDSGGNNVYDITVTASDGSLTNSKAVTITVTNVDDIAPAFTSATTGTAAENQNQLYTAVATDTVDFTTGVVTYSLKAATGDVASLSINSSSGVVTLASGNLDYETKSSYSFTVIATDATGNSHEQAVSITVTNVNEAPTVTSALSTTFAENGTGTAYTVTGTDPDAATTLSYSISGTDAALFNINSSTGAITFKTSPNYESASDSGGNNVYDITVTASDGSLTNSKAVTITVTNVDDIAPAFTSATTGTAAENQNQLYTAVATDTVDFTTGVVTYSLKAATGDVASLSINSSSGVVTLASGNLDYETKSSYSFTVIATDATGNSHEQAVSITVTNVNEAPTVTSALSTTFAENGTGTAYTVTGTDPDAATTLSYSISGTDAALFNINSSTGAITFKTSPNYESASDSGGNNVYDITVTASDGSLTNSKAVTITVTNVDDIAPAFTSATTGTAAENQNQLYTAVATDTVDFTTGVVTYSLKAATGDVASLSINSSSGVVTLASGNLDYETKSSYSFTVIATDATGNSHEQAVSITVTNEGNPPLSSDDSFTTLEDTSIVLTVNDFGIYSDIEGDPLNKVKITSLPLAGLVEYNSSGSIWSAIMLNQEITATDIIAEKLRFRPAADASGTNYTTLQFAVSDGTSYSISSYTLTINVTAVNDASVLVNDTKNINQNNNATGNILTNDSDVDDSLTVASFIIEGNTYTFGQTATIVGKGTITIASNGDYTFIPVTDWNGTIPTITYTTNTGSTASLDITVSEANDDENLKFLSRARVLPPVIKPNINKDLVIDNEEEIDSSKFYEDEEEISIAIKPHFSKASLVNTQLKNSSKPLKIASPEAPTKADKANAQKQNSNDQKNDTGLKNTLTPPDALADNNGHVTYKLPEGTFTNGHGAISLHATQKDGSPLPDWIKFDASTGKIIADVPKGLSAPIEIKVQATDSKGDKAETLFKLKPQTDKVSFIGKKSLSAQLNDAFELIA